MNPSIAGHLKAIFAEALKPTTSHSLVRWTLSHPAHGVPPASFQPTRASGGNSYRVVRNAPLHLAGSVPVALVGCPERCVSELDALLNLVNRAGPGDTVLVEQLHEAGSPILGWRRTSPLHVVGRPSGFCWTASMTIRPIRAATVPRPARVNAVAFAEGLNLEARLANPTNGWHPQRDGAREPSRNPVCSSGQPQRQLGPPRGDPARNRHSDAER